MRPDKERPAEHTFRMVKRIDAVWADFCPAKPCLPLFMDGKYTIIQKLPCVKLKSPSSRPLTVKEAAPPVMIKKIGKTTYRVKIHFSETSKETMSDKIKRLILNDSEKSS